MPVLLDIRPSQDRIVHGQRALLLLFSLLGYLSHAREDEKIKKKQNWEMQAKVTVQGQNKTKDLVQTDKALSLPWTLLLHQQDLRILTGITAGRDSRHRPSLRSM